MAPMPHLISKESILLRAVCLPSGRIACILAPQGDLSAIYQKNITLHGTFLIRERRRLDDAPDI